MRCAFFAATEHGVILGRKLQNELKDSNSITVYAKKGKAMQDVIAYDKMRDAVQSAFSAYDALIFCTATGIAVRMIAPWLQSKLTDPAVVVVDERAKHVISLLSGHVGGGNYLTRLVAEALEAEAIITTATDVNEMQAPDLVAARLGLRPYPKAQIQVLNTALLQRKQLHYWLLHGMKHGEYWQNLLRENGITAEFCNEAELLQRTGRYDVCLSDTAGLEKEGLLYLLPRKLVAGIGCRRDTPKELIRDALQQACQMIGQNIEVVSLLASTVVKKDEPGLLALAEDLGVEIKFFPNKALQEKIDAYALPESEFVKQQIGVGNISAAAALCCVGKGKFALDKTKFTKVTVALVWEK